MATEIKMPQLGETVVEGTITKWLKQEGEEVSADELLVEVSTDKVDSEVPSSASGVLQKILVPEGETVSVGTAIALVGEAGEEAASDGDGGEAKSDEGGEEAEQAEKKPKQEDQQQEDQQQEEQPAAQGQKSPPPPPPPAQQQPAAQGGQQQAAEAPQGEQAAAQAQPSSDTSKRGIISPLVRRLAEEHGVDLNQVQGTGTGGRIRKQDVLKFVESGGAKQQPAAAAQASPQRQPAAPTEAQPAAQPAPSGQREELIPWTNIRRRTAEHMVAASLETARAWNAVEADWTNIVKLRTEAKESFKKTEGFNLTYMPFLARAICETLREMPEVNASFDEENQANLVKHYVNLGIAVALDGGGLIVPVIKGADEKNLVGMARAINDLATRARTKKLGPDDLVGGTFTITNPGPFGSKLSVPIIPRGTTAILAFEAIEKRVVVTDDDSIAIRSMGFLPMSWDHRTIDGAEAAKFLARLRERIETTDFSGELGHYL
jgi:2-oxoglutarate dehydrogenase E2 component (dihydrolipoamide succinyltransferase)